METFHCRPHTTHRRKVKVAIDNNLAHENRPPIRNQREDGNSIVCRSSLTTNHIVISFQANGEEHPFHDYLIKFLRWNWKLIESGKLRKPTTKSGSGEATASQYSSGAISSCRRLVPLAKRQEQQWLEEGMRGLVVPTPLSFNIIRMTCNRRRVTSFSRPDNSNPANVGRSLESCPESSSTAPLVGCDGKWLFPFLIKLYVAVCE